MGAEWRSGGWTAAAVRPALAPRRPGTTQILRNENQSRPMPGPACGGSGRAATGSRPRVTAPASPPA
jgi:hypothetical protein